MHQRQRPRAMSRLARGAAVAVVVALGAAACTDTPEGAPAWNDPMLSATTIDEIASLSETAGAAEFAVQPSVEQVAVTGAAPDVDLVLFDQSGAAAALGTTDEQGSLVFRQVTPGTGYRVANAQNQDDPDVEQVASDPFEVIAIEDSTPQQSFYDAQTLEPGFTYVETRDGTTLSASVYLPGPIEDGPYPTVVEYSGYSPSKPAVNLIGERWDDIKDGLPDGLTEEAVCELAGFACAAPDQPASLLAHAMGYAVVAVNIRGTGCSGGSYDFFEPLQLLDGYDVIETVAAQDWVKNNRVGMVGLSYPGISQLFVASTQPPSLAAIMPFVGLRRHRSRRARPGRHLQRGLRAPVGRERAGRRRTLRTGLGAGRRRRGRHRVRHQPVAARPERRRRRPGTQLPQLRPRGRRPTQLREDRSEHRSSGVLHLVVPGRAGRRARPADVR